MTTGTVKFFNTTKGFGFITPEDGSKDVYVHISEVERSDLSDLTDGQKVSFEIQQDTRGPKAVNLQAG
jgi:CspA family cold shock protein